jgi:ABC-type multidrug transport system ATPase subunit
MFADEPTGNLDWETTQQIMELLQKINDEGKTVVVTTHNHQVVDKMKKRVLEFKRGKLVHDSQPKKVVDIEPEADKKKKQKDKLEDVEEKAEEATEE